MAEDGSARIARDILSEPHIRGRRISVRQVTALVEEAGEDPEAMADRFDLDLADVYHALAYYHDHPREMQTVEDEREAAFTALLESTRTANDRLGEEDMEEWLDHAVDEDDG